MKKGATLFARTFSLAAKKKILIPTALPALAKETLVKQKFDVVLDKTTPLADLIAQNPDTYGLIVRSEKIDESIMEKLPNLKVICRAGAGYNTIDIKAARKRGIDVMNTPGANANAVAEEVVALVLAAFRHIIPADASTRAGLWEKSKFTGRELAHKTVGIVGLGAIGQLVVQRIKGFDCTILGVDPAMSPERAAQLGIKLVDLETIFAQSDVISLHLPETESTKKLIGEKYFSLVKPGTCVVNCAREGIIDEDALRAAKEKTPFFYCNDVYKKDVAGEKSIASAADIMMPHLGASTTEANINAASRAADQIADWANKGIRRYVVNLTAPANMDERFQPLAYHVARVASKYLGSKQPYKVETRYWGDMSAFERFLTPSVVMGLGRDFDPTFEWESAKRHMEISGLEYVNVDTSVDSKSQSGTSISAYPGKLLNQEGHSITVRLLAGSPDNMEEVSVRGTISEGQIIISRINKYEGTFLTPSRTAIMAEYIDRPGVMATLTQILSSNDLNISDLRAPQCKETGTSLAILFLEEGAKEEDVAALIPVLAGAINAKRCFMLTGDPKACVVPSLL